VSPKTAAQHTNVIDKGADTSSADLCVDECVDTTVTVSADDVTVAPVADLSANNDNPGDASTPPLKSDNGVEIAVEMVQTCVTSTATESDEVLDQSDALEHSTDDTSIASHDEETGPSTALTGSPAPADTLAPGLPDPSDVSTRLKNLVVRVSQVEELSRRARETAASDMAHYDGIAASQRQFEDGLAEARRIGQEAETVYERAFGREARAVAEPAVTEAREVQQAFEELADAWRRQADAFLADHPDVETLLTEQRRLAEESRRREIARAKAERFQELVTTADAALRQGLLDEARDCLKMLGREFPAETTRVAPLEERLQHRVVAANDAAARRILFQASELQGRGDFEAAVRLLEAVEVSALSRETSEDVFGRWSAACSLLGQMGDLELLRSSSAQGRGIVLHRDANVPYGYVELSSLGMGPSHFAGRILTVADREGAAIIARARTFRAAELPSEFSTSWYGRSYVATDSTGAPLRH
jgi:hypothetical protein